jgi:arsenate reductase (thioredoxin)
MPGRKARCSWDIMSLFQTLQQRRGRVLFVCFGNSCRSQMAEAFSRAYGGDVIEAASAGVQPASRISRRTRSVMQEVGVPLDSDQAPKNVSSFNLDSFDLIVNLSEYGVPKTDTMVLKLKVQDPMGREENVHREVRDEIERFVRFLAEHFRRARDWSPEDEGPDPNPLYSDECAQASSSV